VESGGERLARRSRLYQTHKEKQKMTELRTQAYGLLLLRLTLGSLFIAHLYWKFFILPGGIARWWSGLEANGYPWFVPWYVTSAEFAGAIFLIPGIYTRYVSLFCIPLMLCAAQFWIVRKGFYFTSAGGELPVIWSVLLLVQALIGDGPYAVSLGTLSWQKPRHLQNELR
jgi:putative oxidoreductase